MYRTSSIKLNMSPQERELYAMNYKAMHGDSDREENGDDSFREYQEETKEMGEEISKEISGCIEMTENIREKI